MNPRGGRIVVTTRPGTDEDCAKPGHCGWCGESMWRVNKAGETVVDRTRSYHADDASHKCRTEVDGSFCWSARTAVFIRAKLASERVLRCEDCGFICDYVYPREDDLPCICGHSSSEHAGHQERIAGCQRVCRHGCDACCQPRPEWAHHTYTQPRGFTLAVRYWEADHEIPLIDGGPHTIENLRCRCGDCHKAKTAREARARAERRRGRCDQLSLNDERGAS